MSNAGYGNHESDRPGSAAATIEGRSPPSSPPGQARDKPARDGAAHPATPGEGASSKGPQGDEVDPGAG